MKVLQVNAYARSGGAAIAASRLTSALQKQHVEAVRCVLFAEGEDVRFVPDPIARWRPLIDGLPVRGYRHRRSPHWANAWIANQSAVSCLNQAQADLIHLHWINHGMFSLRDIAKLQAPVVWTFHDAWGFTGGCHTPQDCRKFVTGCGACPELRSKRKGDISARHWRRKQKAWHDSPFTVITPSQWLAGLAKSSPLMDGKRMETIPNAIDTSVFKPMDRGECRQSINLPLDKPLLLFAAHGAWDDWNKGGDLLQRMMPDLIRSCPDAEAVVAGSSSRSSLNLPVSVHELGALDPERMAMAMNAVNAVVVPSRFENLPNMIAESLSCGVPVAAFRTGGIPEMVEDGVQGFLAEPGDTNALAAGLSQLLLADVEQFRDSCLAQARQYDPEAVAKRHRDLYEELLHG